MVECTSPQVSVQDLFLETVGLLVLDQKILTPEALARLLEDLVALFRAMDSAPRTSVLGLWGELWLLAGAAEPMVSASAWHLLPGERWDFSLGNARVEVKTTVGSRQHNFALEQLKPPAAVDVVVASIVTSQLGAGPSIQELLEAAVARLVSTEAVSRLVKTAMASLGIGWDQGRSARYDAALAHDTLRFLDARDIPRVPDPPVEVSDVRFRVDVEDVEPVTRDVDGLSPLVKALTPKSRG